MRVTTTITNELGNAVLLIAETYTSDGIPFVKIEIEGPTSKSVNEITAKEASALRTILSDIGGAPWPRKSQR